jgi:DNA-binding NarL/FixJ family response regulator
MTKKIVIGDDHPMVRAALKTAIASVVPDLIAFECSSLDEIIAAISAERSEIDLVLLDLSMPGPHGFSALFLLAAQFPTVPVAIVSARSDPATIERAIAYGASGYIPKSVDLQDLKTAITTILAGEIWISAGSNVGQRDSDDANAVAGRFASLSLQQMKILMMIVDGKLNKQIAGDLAIAEQTVKVHVSAILRKLGVGSRTQAAVLAQRLLATESEPQE